MRASDTQTTKVLKCAKRCEYKEDFFRWLPNLFDHTKKIDISNPPLDLFGRDDVAISEVVDKPKAMQALDKLIDDTIEILLDLDMAKLAMGLRKKYDGMKTEDRNIGVVEGKSQKELIKAQIADFSF